jgi:hypothetical protein
MIRPAPRIGRKDPETVKLTIIHRDLIRGWAEVNTQ